MFCILSTAIYLPTIKKLPLPFINRCKNNNDEMVYTIIQNVNQIQQGFNTCIAYI